MLAGLMLLILIAARSRRYFDYVSDLIPAKILP